MPSLIRLRNMKHKQRKWAWIRWLMDMFREQSKLGTFPGISMISETTLRKQQLVEVIFHALILSLRAVVLKIMFSNNE